MRLFRSHGVKDRRYWHDVPGHNFRLTNMQAALGCAQLAQFDRICAERARLYNDYVVQLRNLPGVTLQQMTDGVDPVVWAVGILLDPAVFRTGRDGVIVKLAEAGIETRPGFHASNEMSHIYGTHQLPVASHVASHVLSLPSSPTVTTAEIAYIVGHLAKCASR
jgi:perosamine synthetase